MSRMMLMVWSVFVVLMGVVGGAGAQTASFSYQGVLNDGVMAADGSFDFRFSLYSVETGGSALGTDEHLGVAVSEGVFDVMLDFGSVFGSGSDRYIGIEVREAGMGSYEALDPRVLIGRVPFAAHADRADVATFALDGPFAPEDTTPGSTSGAPGMNVSVSAAFDGLVTSGWEVVTPIRIEREVIDVNGEVTYGDAGDFVVELVRLWDESTLYADLFEQGISPVEVSIVVTRGPDRTDYVFSSGAISGHRFENDPDSNGFVEVVTVVFQPSPIMDPLSTYTSRVSTGFNSGGGSVTGLPFGGGDAPREGLYFYEFDGYTDPFSNVGALPGESRLVLQRFPVGQPTARPVSILMNVFSDRLNMFWGAMTGFGGQTGRLFLVDDRGTRLWEAEAGMDNRALVGSWTLDRADDGGLFEIYEIVYNPAQGF